MILLRQLGNSNIVGFAGLSLVFVAVVAVAGFWWAVLLLGLFLLGFAYLLGQDENQADAGGPVPPASGASEPAAGRRATGSA